MVSCDETSWALTLFQASIPHGCKSSHAQAEQDGRRGLGNGLDARVEIRWSHGESSHLPRARPHAAAPVETVVT